jgi:hypothetical protein
MWIGEKGLPQSQIEDMKMRERVDRNKDDIEKTGDMGRHFVSIN